MYNYVPNLSPKNTDNHEEETSGFGSHSRFSYSLSSANDSSHNNSHNSLHSLCSQNCVTVCDKMMDTDSLIRAKDQVPMNPFPSPSFWLIDYYILPLFFTSTSSFSSHLYLLISLVLPLLVCPDYSFYVSNVSYSFFFLFVYLFYFFCNHFPLFIIVSPCLPFLPSFPPFFMYLRRLSLAMLLNVWAISASFSKRKCSPERSCRRSSFFSTLLRTLEIK